MAASFDNKTHIRSIKQKVYKKTKIFPFKNLFTIFLCARFIDFEWNLHIYTYAYLSHFFLRLENPNQKVNTLKKMRKEKKIDSTGKQNGGTAGLLFWAVSRC